MPKHTFKVIDATTSTVIYELETQVTGGVWCILAKRQHRAAVEAALADFYEVDRSLHGLSTHLPFNGSRTISAGPDAFMTISSGTIGVCPVTVSKNAHGGTHSHTGLPIANHTVTFVAVNDWS